MITRTIEGTKKKKNQKDSLNCQIQTQNLANSVFWASGSPI